MQRETSQAGREQVKWGLRHFIFLLNCFKKLSFGSCKQGLQLCIAACYVLKILHEWNTQLTIWPVLFSSHSSSGCRHLKAKVLTGNSLKIWEKVSKNCVPENTCLLLQFFVSVPSKKIFFTLRFSSFNCNF